MNDDPLRVMLRELPEEWENPYCRLLYEPMQRRGARIMRFSRRQLFSSTPPDVFHLHWPESALRAGDHFGSRLFSVLRTLGALNAFRLRGTRVVWTAHNLQAHERTPPRLASAFWKGLVRSVDGVIFLSDASRKQAFQRYSALRPKPSVVIPHGHYRSAYPDTLSQAEAREQLDVSPDAQVIAFVGIIRPYKNVPTLIRTFRAMATDASAHLLIGGCPWTDALEAEVRDAAHDASQVHLALGFIPEDKIQLYLRAANLAVLPFQRILNSGSALLSLSFDCPVLVPHQGSLPELQQHVGSNWVRTYRGALRPEDLRDALDWAVRTPRAERAPLDDLEWPALAQQTMAFYRDLLK